MFNLKKIRQFVYKYKDYIELIFTVIIGAGVIFFIEEIFRSM